MRALTFLLVLTGAFVVGCGSQQEGVTVPTGPLPGDMIDAAMATEKDAPSDAAATPSADAPAPEAKKDEAANDSEKKPEEKKPEEKKPEEKKD